MTSGGYLAGFVAGIPQNGRILGNRIFKKLGVWHANLLVGTLKWGF